MMTAQQFRLLKLTEECNEAGKEAAKQMQFGRDFTYYEQPNHVRTRDEILDVLVTVMLLEQMGEIEPITFQDVLKHYRGKREKIIRHTHNAIGTGLVSADILNYIPEL